jgi:tetratricopeptide (TPR) repeat protein
MSTNRLDEARSLHRSGRTAEAIAAFEAAERSARDPLERAEILPFLCGAYEKGGRLEDAVRVGRAAVKAAEGGSDETIGAHAKLSLGCALFADFLRKGPADPDWSVFKEAMALGESASEIYERAGKIDYASALLIMADAYRTVDILDGAGALWARVVKELSEEPWLPTEAETMGRHIDYLRGRAWMGLGYVALHYIDQDEARRRFDIAVDMLQSGEPQVFKADLEAIAETVAKEIGDPEAAEEIRRIAVDASSG